MKEFSQKMHTDGWCVFPKFFSEYLIGRMRNDIELAYSRCREIQISNGIANTEGTVHHLIGYEPSFIECLAGFKELNTYLEEYFGGKYILNAFGGNILRKGMSYASQIHRDIRNFSDHLPLMLNTIVMLDDFTEDNGATWLMESGHKWGARPSEKDFSSYAFQIVAPAGTVVMFNSNMWHRAGENKTDKPRRSITPMFTRPFYKPQFNYTQFVEENYSEYLKQVLGYYSRIPCSMNEWYQEKRFYRNDQ